MLDDGEADCMTDDSTSTELLDGPNAVYADSVTVIYRSVEAPSSRTPRETIVMIADGALQVDRERLRIAAHQLVWVPTDRGLTNESFISEERYTYTSWGASGGFLDLILWASTAAGGGVVGSAAWSGLLRLLAQLRLGDSAHTVVALAGRSAQRRAIQMAFANFPDLDRAKTPTVLSCNLTGELATVVLRPADGSTITVTLTVEENGAVGTITRAYPEA
jgi:hypothetical protein